MHIILTSLITSDYCNIITSISDHFWFLRYFCNFLWYFLMFWPITDITYWEIIASHSYYSYHHTLRCFTYFCDFLYSSLLIKYNESFPSTSHITVSVFSSILHIRFSYCDILSTISFVITSLHHCIAYLVPLAFAQTIWRKGLPPCLHFYIHLVVFCVVSWPYRHCRCISADC